MAAILGPLISDKKLNFEQYLLNTHWYYTLQIHGIALRTQTTFLTVCTTEYRLHSYYNRFRVNQETYRRKVVTINRKIKRFTRSIDTKIIDLGRRRFTLQRQGDGVHFTVGGGGGQNSFCHIIDKVISAYAHRSSS